eukprot:g70505.t1
MFLLAGITVSSAVASLVTTSDIEGAWTEVGDCYVAECQRDRYMRTIYQFAAPNEDGIQHYIKTTKEFHGQNMSKPCEKETGNDMVMSIAIQGQYVIDEEEISGWSGMGYKPQQYTITTTEAYTSDYLHSWPEGACVNMIEYLNTYCPCKGTWVAGKTRTITLPDADHNTLTACKREKEECTICPKGTCNVFYNTEIFGNLMKTHKQRSEWLSITHDKLNKVDGYSSTAVAHTLMRLEVAHRFDVDPTRSPTRFDFDPRTPKLQAENVDGDEGEKAEKSEAEGEGEGQGSAVAVKSHSGALSVYITVAVSTVVLAAGALWYLCGRGQKVDIASDYTPINNGALTQDLA